MRRTDTVALVIVVVSAVLVSLFLQGFWSIVLSISTCGGLLWYTVLGVILAVVIFYAQDRNSTLLWGVAIFLLLIFVVLALYLTTGGAAAWYPAC